MSLIRLAPMAPAAHRTVSKRNTGVTQQHCRDRRSVSACLRSTHVWQSGVLLEVIPEAFPEPLLALAFPLASLRALDFRDDHSIDVRLLAGADGFAQIVSYFPQFSDDRGQSGDRLGQGIEATGRNG